MGEATSLYAQQLANALQASPHLVGIAQYLQSVTDPRGALRQNVSQFCALLQIAVDPDSDQGYRILEALFQQILGPLPPPSVYEHHHHQHHRHKVECMTQRRNDYKDYDPTEDPYESSANSQALQHLQDASLGQPGGRLVPSSAPMLNDSGRIITGTITQPVVSSAMMCEPLSSTSDDPQRNYYERKERLYGDVGSSGQYEGQVSSTEALDFKTEAHSEDNVQLSNSLYGGQESSSGAKSSNETSCHPDVENGGKSLGLTVDDNTRMMNEEPRADSILKAPLLAIKFDELLGNLGFVEKVELLQGLSCCGSELNATMEAIQQCGTEKAEKLLSLFKAKVLDVLVRASPAVFLLFGTSIIQNFPFPSNNGACCQCSKSDTSVEDLRRLFFIKLAEALRTVGLTESPPPPSSSPTAETPNLTSTTVSSNESSDAEKPTTPEGVRRSKRKSSKLPVSQSSPENTCKRQKTSEITDATTWEPPARQSKSPEAKAVASISYLVPLLSGLCSNDPGLAIQVSDILNAQGPLEREKRFRGRSSSDSNFLDDIKSDLKSAFDASNGERKSALIKPVNEKDTEILRMPNHIVTKSGVILPPTDSVLYLSKVVGVVWDKIHNSWVVNYTLLGRRYFQHFPAKKFGFLEGRKLAIELRLAKDREKALVEGTVRGGGRRAQGPSWESANPPRRRRRRRKVGDGLETEELNDQVAAVEELLGTGEGGKEGDGSAFTQQPESTNFDDENSDVKSRIHLGGQQQSELSTHLAQSSPNSPQALPTRALTSSEAFIGQQTESQESSVESQPILESQSNNSPHEGLNGVDVLHPQTTSSSDASRLSVLMQTTTPSLMESTGSMMSAPSGMRVHTSLSPPTLNGQSSSSTLQHLMSQHPPNETRHLLHQSSSGSIPPDHHPLSSRSLQHHQLLQFGVHHLGHLHPSNNNAQQHEYP